MNKTEKKYKSVLLISFIFLSSVFIGLGAMTLADINGSATSPEAADGYDPLANEDSIVDPRGQTVKRSQTIELGRSVTLDLVQPIDWTLNIFDFDVLDVQIPMDLDLDLGLTFPLNVETSYNPYDVHAGESFPFVIDLDNFGCTPSLDIGVDFEMDFADLNFNFLGLGNLLSFATNWGSIDYEKDIEIPFYGVETKLGNWLSYDILDKYYSLESILGIDLDWDQFAISGGVGVNIQYNLYSYVTANAVIDSSHHASPSEESIRWDDIGAKTVDVAVDPAADHGELYSVEIGDWVYHIAHDVTFTVWAELGLEVLSLDIIDEKLDYSYTLGMGELTFPEKTDYTFKSYPEVLSGTSMNGATATQTAIGFDYGPNGGNFQFFDYDVGIPEQQDLQQWLSDMDVDFSLGASIDINFPYNIISYYNARKVTSGGVFDYNVLVDSVGAGSPSIDYNIDFMLDLSSVNVLGFDLGTYEFNDGGELFSINGLGTPFGTDISEVEITDTIGLDSLSAMLNDYLSSIMYGINPDIQFQAWIVLQLDAYMTGTVQLTNGATVLEATEFRWDEQFDTQTTRIQVPESLSPGQTFDVTYTDLEYHLELTPGIKLGVSVLGGIVGFDYTFMIPGVSQYLQEDFSAPDFVEEVEVNELGFEIESLTVDDPLVSDGDFTVTGDFDLTNIGTTTDQYVISLIDDNLPTGTIASWTGGSLPDTTGVILVDETEVIEWTLNLGPDAHKSEYVMNELVFEVKSNTDASLIGTLSTTLEIMAEEGLINTEVVMEEEVDIKPGVGVVVPVPIENNGLVTVDYDISVVGDDVNVLSETSLSLDAGESSIFEYEIDVPAESSSTAGDYGVTLTVEQAGALDIVKELTYTVPEFTLVGLNLLDGDNQVDIDDGANFDFRLSNDGNVEGNVNVSVNGIDGYEVEGLEGKQELSLISGASGVACLVSFDAADLEPGLNEFELLVEQGTELLYAQNFTISVTQLTCTVSSENNKFEYIDETLHYTLDITNDGSVADTFNIEIEGLDPSAYTLEASASNLYLPGSSSAQLDLYISPDDITAVRGGLNGIAVKVSSSTYEYSSYIGGSGVIMPEVYSFDIPNEYNDVQTGIQYVMSFTIENAGNVADIFDIVVENIDPNIEYNIESANLVENSDNQIEIRRGESVEVSIVFNKSIMGKFKPMISIVNSDNEVMQDYKGHFWNGIVYSPAFVIVLVLSIVAGAAALLAVGMYSRGMTMPVIESRVLDRVKVASGEMKRKLSEAKGWILNKIDGVRKPKKKQVSYDSIVYDTFDETEKKLNESTPKPRIKDKLMGIKERISDSKAESEEEDYWNLDEDDDFEF
ncbi:MAG: hypothetical protein GF364_07545 [Candidatus Lokiarchaeota archaeon]|nr:hypothetical protein [Candidatus Lokiarchaeota archaeon]